jgi:hypothetical protein
MLGTIDLSQARPFDEAGIRRRVIITYTPPASYATGGDSILPGDIGNLGVIEEFPEQIATNGTAIVCFIYNFTTQKLQAFQPSTNVEIAAAVNLSAYISRIEVMGR